jgi:hypothetical protein
MTHKVTLKLRSGQVLEGEHESPDRAPMCGDTYEFTRSTVTKGGHNYEVGDRLLVIERTGMAPHGYQSSLGNLLVRSKYGTSVWSCFDHCVAEGRLKLVEA